MANTKTILVTGAGSGIGRAIAQRLSKNNYPLILLGRNQDKLEETRNSLESPEKHQCISCDIRLPKDIANALEKRKINSYKSSRKLNLNKNIIYNIKCLIVKMKC